VYGAESWILRKGSQMLHLERSCVWCW
jgi:hypothetical protein